jgi:signal transduction histidine kinase/phage shock protein PspC (stress-responsive transcriptional regulator)
VVAGVADGLGRYLGVDPLIVRIGFVLATLAGGIGVPVYIAAWLIMPAADSAEPRPAGRHGRGVRSALQGHGIETALAIGMVVLGGLLLIRELGVWFVDALVWPLTLAGFGAAVVWARIGESDRARLSRIAGMPANGERTPPRWATFGRLVLGGFLAVAGVVVFVPLNENGGSAEIALSMFVAVAGLLLLTGPWVGRLLSELKSERRERIRSEERAEMAAHLHDSVLQTLALIQRNSDRPRELMSLARRQERELRAWLYGDPSRRQQPTTLASAVELMAEEVEARHDVEVDVVNVGDFPLDERVAAMVAAAREAVVNAAKHSGTQAVSVYVEVELGKILVFVRDRGNGFDPNAVPPDRRGISESIRHRVVRRGGHVSITSEPGWGTEVQLELPVDEEVS